MPALSLKMQKEFSVLDKFASVSTANAFQRNHMQQLYLLYFSDQNWSNGFEDGVKGLPVHDESNSFFLKALF